MVPVKQEKPGGAKLDPEKTVIPMLVELSKADFGDAALLPDDEGLLAVPVALPAPPAEAAAHP